MKAAIVIGASSGIGRALALALARDGFRVGAMARRADLLTSLQAEIGGATAIRTVDVSRPDVAMPLLQALIDELGDVELFIVSAGVGSDNPDFDWAPEEQTIAVNVVGFAAMVNVAVAHLRARGRGHLVGISSVAAVRGLGAAPAYAASKAFVSSYLQGIRYRLMRLKLPIVVTDVKPGFVETRMAGGDFWMASPETAARQILAAVRKQQRHAYVTRRWRLVAWLMRIVPDAWYAKV